jgi:hypothetical protein
VKKILMIMAVAVLLGACGGGNDDSTGQNASSSNGGDDNSADDKYVEFLATAFNADDEQLDLDETQSTCLAQGVVDAIGADTLKDADISPEDLASSDDLSTLDVTLPADAVDSLGQSIAGCNLVPMLEDKLVLSSFSDSFGYDLPPDGAACMSEKMDDVALGTAVAELFLVPDAAGESLQTVMLDALVACPDVAAAGFIAEAPAPLSPEGEACVTQFVTDNPDTVKAVLGSGGSDTAAVQELGTQLATACPEFAGA